MIIHSYNFIPHRPLRKIGMGSRLIFLSLILPLSAFAFANGIEEPFFKSSKDVDTIKVEFIGGVGFNNPLFFQTKYSIDSIYNTDFTIFANSFHLKYVPKLSYDLLGLAKFPIYKNKLFFLTGLEIIERSYATIKKSTSYANPGYENIIGYTYNFISFEIPINLMLKINRISIMPGISLPLINIRKETTTFTTQPKDSYSILYGLSDIWRPGHFCNTYLTIGYSIPGKVSFGPYLTFEYSYLNEFYLHYGISLNF